MPNSIIFHVKMEDLRSGVYGVGKTNVAFIFIFLSLVTTFALLRLNQSGPSNYFLEKFFSH